MLDVIQQEGYQGVEFAQRTDFLGDIDGLLRLLEERGLALVGLAGGSLRQRMDFCGRYTVPYLYVEDWEEDIAKEAIGRGFTLALHPHIFTQVHRIADAKQLLAEHAALRFLPDTAHLVIAGDNPVKAIEQTIARIVAVHLKDWTPVFGRSPHRYAKGFVGLGKGKLPLPEVLDTLRRLDFQGWLIVEQDHCPTSISASIAASTTWLAEHGVSIQRNSLSCVLPIPEALTSEEERPTESSTAPEETKFLRTVAAAGVRSLESCWQTLATAFREMIPCDVITIWTCCLRQGLMSLQAIQPEQLVPSESLTLNFKQVLSGDCIANQFVTKFDLTLPDNVRRFGHPEMLKKRQPRWMISLPIMNPWNPHYVWLIVNLFRQSSDLPVTEEKLFELGQYAGLAVNAAVVEFCACAASKTSFIAPQSQREKDFLDEFVCLVQEVLDCEGVSIFTLSDAEDTLLLAATTGLISRTGDATVVYDYGTGIVGNVWERNEIFITRDARKEKGWEGRSEEKVASPHRHECLYAPLVNHTGQVIGVIRCRNKRQARNVGTSTMFTDEDAAVLDSMTQAAIPQLEVLRDHEVRINHQILITHELLRPAVAVKNTVHELLAKPGVPRLFKRLFKHDYFGNILSWIDLMLRQIENSDLVHGTLMLETSATFMLRDVVAPAVRQLDLELSERDFSESSIRYDKFVNVPQVYIDRNRIQQVFFNLLSNSIKYAYKDPEAFNVQIVSERRSPYFAIMFRDWGPGIQDGMEEKIFWRGFRAPGDATKTVTGRGIGLWVVRRVIEAHDGIVKVTSKHSPFEITILLPEYLESRPPKTKMPQRTMEP